MINKNPNSLKSQGFFVIAGQTITFSASIVSIKILTETLSPEEYGRLSLGITVTLLLNQILTGGIGAAIARIYTIAHSQNELTSYLEAVNYIRKIVCVAIISLGAAVVGFIKFYCKPGWVTLAIVAVFLSVVTCINDIQNAIHNAAQRRFAVAFNNSLNALAKIILPFILTKVYGSTGVFVLTGYVASMVLTIVANRALLKFYKINNYTPGQNRGKWLNEIWKYALPVSTWGAFMCLKQLSDRWALQLLATSQDVGKYSVLLQIGFAPIVQIGTIGLSFLSPILFNIVGDASDKFDNLNIHNKLWKYLKYCGILVIGIVAATAVFHRIIFEKLVASEYRNESYLLPWMLVAGGAFAAGQVLSLELEAGMRPADMILAKALSTTIGVVLNILGAWLWGVPGVVAALATYCILYFGWMAQLSRSAMVVAKR